MWRSDPGPIAFQTVASTLTVAAGEGQGKVFAPSPGGGISDSTFQKSKVQYILVTRVLKTGIQMLGLSIILTQMSVFVK